MLVISRIVLKATPSLKQLTSQLGHAFRAKHREPPQLLPDQVLFIIVSYLPHTAKGRLRTVNSLFYAVAARCRYERVFVSFLADAGTRSMQILQDARHYNCASSVRTLVLLAARMRESSVIHRDNRLVLSPPTRSALAHELTLALPMFLNLHQLDIQWGYEQATSFSDTFHTLWSHIGSRLKVLRMEISATNTSHLASLPAVGSCLEELILAIETRDDECGDFDRLGGVAETLVLPARESLAKLDITLRTAPRYGNRTQGILAGLFFEALEDAVFPRLETVIVRAPFRGADSGHDERTLASFLHTQAIGGALANLSVTPGSAATRWYPDVPSTCDSTYGSFLQNFAMDAHAWSSIRRLSLLVPSMEVSSEALPRVLDFIRALSSPLKEVSFNERFFDIHEVLQVVQALSYHACSLSTLRMGIRELTPAVCDALAAQLTALDTLEIIIGCVRGDEYHPVRTSDAPPQLFNVEDDHAIDAFNHEMSRRRYLSWPLRWLAVQQVYSDGEDDSYRVHHINALEALQRAVPSLARTDTSRSLGWDWPRASE